MTAPVSAASWSTAVPDWKDRIREGRSMVPDLPLHDAVAEKALRIFNELPVLLLVAIVWLVLARPF